MAALDGEQVAKAVKALQAYVKKNRNDAELFVNENENIMLNVTVWKIPNKEQTIKINLPHGIRSESYEVCLFTKDEPNVTADQTKRFYIKLLSKHGIKNITQVIPYKTLKTEYKPYEAKRRLLSSFNLFLADDRIRRLLPSHLGKHFYTSKNTTIVAHTGMKPQEAVENVTAAVRVIAQKLPMQWKNVKVLHLKTPASVALPIYASGMQNLQDLQQSFPESLNKQHKAKKQKKTKVVKSKILSTAVKRVLVKTVEKKSKKSKPSIAKKLSTEEEIPQLVPIEEQPVTKKAKLQFLPN
ncbi:hypothetical protein chiPu_0011642 [Chiloscyllium punctatum]|uniref:Ribosomal L1 domain-containing protein 1 n=1 Tax=Chiloscyllium punctatum TaxID=137246 RepID=A0A401SRZ4_CHIPU|nr:hypothetical protein [Chiloscyllium punctatum]